MIDSHTRLRVASRMAKTETEASQIVFSTLKQRENGRVVAPELRVIYGEAEEMLALLGKSTSYIERSNLISRHCNSRLTRKTLAFSKTIAMPQAAAALEDAYYNLVRSHKTLRQEVIAPDRRWSSRTPAMASALTDIFGLLKNYSSLT